MDIEKEWDNYLIKVEIARGHHILYNLDQSTTIFKSLCDDLYSSLLFVNLCSIFDEILIEFITNNNIHLTRMYHNTFGGRCKFFTDNNYFIKPRIIKIIKNKRNELAHDINCSINWKYLEKSINYIFNEIINLGYNYNLPKLNSKASRSAYENSPEANVLSQCIYSYIVENLSNHNVLFQVNWTKKIFTSNA